uniref:transmembrane protein 68-like n=1 Tax=Styela clava TaxID=7725 RepID=UPI00193A8821|nr:transmembrane protein 68-like [Styela clava]
MSTLHSHNNEMMGFFIPWIAAMIQHLIGILDYYLFWAIDLLNYYMPGWKLVVLSPFVITFIILPTFVVLYLYIGALLLYIYRRRHAIYEGFHQHNVWEGYKKMIAAMWSGHGWIWHGYEVKGLENLPNRGAAMIVYFHGALPIDLYYLNATVYIEKNRTLCGIMDNFAFKIPGLKNFFQFWGCFPGPRDRMVEILKAGEIVTVAPGGVREALFSENYSVLWGERQGFAKAALEARVPIIPMFTENLREAFCYMQTGKKWYRKLYEYTRWPLRPLYGGFPVKLTTHIGRPIYFDSNTPPAEVATKTRHALEQLIRRHQRIPGSIILSFVQRFTSNYEKEFEVLPVEGTSGSEDSSESEVSENGSACKLLDKSKSEDNASNNNFRTPFLVCQCKECDALKKMNLGWESLRTKGLSQVPRFSMGTTAIDTNY